MTNSPHEITGHLPSQDMKPDLNEVLQLDVPPELTVIPVTIAEPVESRELPSKRIAPRTVPLLTNAASQLLSRDPRRKRATLIARTGDIRIGANQSQAQLNGGWLPDLTFITIATEAEVWGIADTVATDVTVIEEYWA